MTDSTQAQTGFACLLLLILVQSGFAYVLYPNSYVVWRLTCRSSSCCHLLNNVKMICSMALAMASIASTRMAILMDSLTAEVLAEALDRPLEEATVRWVMEG